MKKIPVANPNFGEKEAKAVFNVVKSGWVTMGKKVKIFEKKIAKFCGTKYAIATNNGTSSLDALLTAINIKSNDEVIVPSLTYISTANVVLYKRAKLILCDNDEKTFNTNKNFLENKISNKTKLIIVTDMKGMPLDYDKLKKLSKIKKIPIIIDSAESFGAKYKNQIVGSQLLAHSFSFFANKNITTGEGGMIVTNNQDLYKKLNIIRNQGQTKRYHHTMLGNNYRMTDIMASIGIEQLKKIKKIIIEKNKLAKYYNKKLSQIKGVEIPFIPNYVSQHSWYNYSIQVDKNKRNKLVNFLRLNGVETRLSFPPIHIQPYYKKNFNFKKNHCINAINSFYRLIDLPIWFGLKKKEQDKVVNLIKKFFKKTN